VVVGGRVMKFPELKAGITQEEDLKEGYFEERKH